MLIEASLLSSQPGIRHAYFTRQGGVSEGVYATLNGGIGSGDVRERVLENRRRMAEELAVEPERFVTLHQIHSATAIVVEEAPAPGAERVRADGMATRVKGLALAVAGADCGPVLFADAHAGVIGAAHAGWRGALSGVLDATLEAMESLGASRASTVAVLGPMISQGAYEVGPEVVRSFTESDPANTRFFASAEREGHAFLDLPGYIVARLETLGTGEVDALGLCTYANEEMFFSYRRATHRGEPDYGRLLSAIALIP